MSYPKEWDDKAPRLKKIADWINEHTTLLAEMERGYCNTDRRIRNGGRHLRIEGKGRRGTRLKVWANMDHRLSAITIITTKKEKKLREKYGLYPLLDHNAAETYRCNSDVIEWLSRHLRDNPKALKSD